LRVFHEYEEIGELGRCWQGFGEGTCLGWGVRVNDSL